MFQNYDDRSDIITSSASSWKLAGKAQAFQLSSDFYDLII